MSGKNSPRLPLSGAPSFALIVTRGHAMSPRAQGLDSQTVPVFGMIGSARKARTIFDHSARKNRHAGAASARGLPGGHHIKSQSVQEIAVSIMAQFIEKRAMLVYEQAGSRGPR